MRALFVILACLAVAARAHAAPRLAVVVGANQGGADDPPLRFAERDATRVAETLRDIGGVARADLTLLTGTSAPAVRAAIADARRRAGSGGTLVFYYSGHAGLDGLHVRGDVLAWSELRALTDTATGGDLRIVLVDACHAGELARPKGFVGVPAGDAGDRSEGSAVLAAAEWFEPAQESDALGGSFFTNALVSGLRGAADTDGNGVITLDELHAYVNHDTTARTAATTGFAQHPTSRFDIAGRGDVVLARLRDSDARVVLGAPLEGTVAVLERDSPYVVVETRKARGEPLAFALPRGRYVVYVRGTASVGIADVTLPWGGEARLDPADLTARSYQDVALKGGIVDVRSVRVRAGASLETAPLRGMGLVPALAVAAGRRVGGFELGARAAVGRSRFDAVDTSIRTTFVEAGLFAAREWPRRLWDLRAFAALDVGRWWQDITGAEHRAGVVPGLGLGVGARVPLAGRSFVETDIEGRALFPDVQGEGRAARAVLRAALSLGWLW